MNKRGLVDRAFTLLFAAGIIAIAFLLFGLATNTFITKQKFDVTVNIDAISTAGQLRTVLSILADDFARKDCSRLPQVIKDAFGQATAAVYADGQLVCGAAVAEPTGIIETLLPAYDTPTNPVKIRLEVKRV